MVYEFGPRVLRLRRKRGWSQSDLARRIEKSSSTVSAYESDTVPHRWKPPPRLRMCLAFRWIT